MIGFEQTRIGGHKVAGTEAYQIAWHNLCVWQFHPFAVSPDGGRRSNTLPKALDRLLRMIRLKKDDADAEQDHHQNDAGVNPLPCRYRNKAGGKKDNDE